MRKKYDKGYVSLLKKVKNKMPKYYGVILNTRYPEIGRDRVYNAINHGVQDWEVIRAMADVLEINNEVKA
jgi:hypothetical protein